jgi:hypothetical protein
MYHLLFLAVSVLLLAQFTQDTNNSGCFIFQDLKTGIKPNLRWAQGSAVADSNSIYTQ